MVAVSLVVVGPDRPRPTTLLPPSSDGKPEAATAVDRLLMMGMRMPETCWAVFKRQAIKLRDWCNWLVDFFECMKMHGLTNPKKRPIPYFSFVVHVIISHELTHISSSCPHFYLDTLTQLRCNLWYMEDKHRHDPSQKPSNVCNSLLLIQK